MLTPSPGHFHSELLTGRKKELWDHSVPLLTRHFETASEKRSDPHPHTWTPPQTQISWVPYVQMVEAVFMHKHVLMLGGMFACRLLCKST